MFSLDCLAEHFSHKKTVGNPTMNESWRYNIAMAERKQIYLVLHHNEIQFSEANLRYLKRKFPRKDSLSAHVTVCI